jgi:hypothetical protein
VRQRLCRLARNTGFSATQVDGVRLELLRIGALVEESQRWVHVGLASACPTQALGVRLAWRLGLRVARAPD